mmetsp:Transcript_17931/g.53969  ORF Transcript_17931/g.53969 Transcript_17931/m.53969 type:complete len:526 (+) Transcript_17931:343-1920(+)|eukprot:CAMPEP_0206135400 /NCGR_PEP_ID=MMETSP1473-20131121/703_1 /ASSEMBLY_ACC=CAM_ASM_001109 /TAXON_ID=1461547 /ORGANISM="Stichococcus sp, Strain RCC1054" /LENGTH=525 /DNA_ID=CAMNT_0053527261 /DNA_START=332 /DNA_END=1909 /DNA_ORIENTATION=-
MDVTAARDETKRLVTSQMSHEVGQVPPGINDSPDDAAHSTSAAVTGPGGPEEEFLCGVALSVYQNSGDGGTPTNWGIFENQKTWIFNNIANGDKCGNSNDFWNLYEEDIERAAALNVKFFRLSIEWSRIQPRRGEVDLEAVQRYHDIFDVLDRHKMETTVTLYHFVHPHWFEELGQFQRPENIQLFVDYAKIAFRHFGSRSKLWATFNEVNVQTFCSYIYGSFPPAKMFQFGAAGHVFLHMYQAHIEAYHAIKGLKGGERALVGIVHNFMTYEAKYPVAISAAWVNPIVEVINKCWGNDLTINFLTTGKFTWPSFFSKEWSWQYPEGRPPCDFVGLNYYGRGMIDWTLAPTHRRGDLTTDMPFAAYAPGLYHAIASMAEIELPIYITETGICDHTSLKRPAFFKAYLDELVQAVQDGHDVRGITMWTLIDNFEWAYGFDKKFGLYGWSPDDPTNRRTLHDTSKVLAEHYITLPKRIQEARNKWAARKLEGSVNPHHVPPPEEQAKDLLRHLHVREAVHTGQVGVI